MKVVDQAPQGPEPEVLGHRGRHCLDERRARQVRPHERVHGPEGAPLPACIRSPAAGQAGPRVASFPSSSMSS